MLTIDQIRAATKRVAVELPEFGLTAYAVGLKGGERITIAAANTMADGNIELRGFMCSIIAATVVGPDEQPLVTPELADQLPEDVFQRLYRAAAGLNGLLANAVEDAAKNSDAAPSGDSPSASQGT